jgi:hypothetical protein
MLTGKDVYEATLFATSDIAGKWDKLNTFDKHVYEVAASVLNGNHIAPMQDRMKRLESNERATFNDALCIIGDTLTDAMTVASDLQSQITALKALVKDYQEFTKHQTPLLKAGRLEWEAKSNELYQRAQKLRGEEPTK